MKTKKIIALALLLLCLAGASYGQTVKLSTDKTEINENGGTAQITATLSAVSATPVTVSLILDPYSAELNKDFTLSTTPPTITIPAGAISKSITLSAIDNSIKDFAKYIILLNGSNIIDSILIKINDDEPVINLSVSSSRVFEDVSTTTIYAELDRVATSNVIVQLNFSDKAERNTDYTCNNTITVSKGQSSGYAILTTIQDNIIEGNENISIRLSPSSSYGVGTNSTVNDLIIDDDFVSNIQDALIDNHDGCGVYGLPAKSNYGTFSQISASYTPSSNCVYQSRTKTLVKIDLSSLPANAIITSAYFIMKATSNSTTPSLFRKVMTGSWAENTVTWNTQPTSYSTTETVVVPSCTIGNPVSVDITKFATYWYRNPDKNLGMIYELSSAITTAAINNFASTDNATIGMRPQFVIEFTVPENPSVIYVKEDATITSYSASGMSSYDDKNFVNSNNEILFTPKPAGVPVTNMISRSLLQFDLSSVKATSVSNAKLVLSPLTFTGTSTNLQAYVNKIIAPTVWNPVTVTWNTKPTGGYVAGVSGVIPAQTAGTKNPATPIEIDITAIVNSWISNPSSNLGLEIVLKNENPTTATSFIFASEENDNPAYHPRIVLNGYTKSGYAVEEFVEDEEIDVISTTPVGVAVSVYPNPADNEITIETNGVKDKINTIEIVDIAGNIITKFQPLDVTSIVDITSLQVGFYIIKINTDTNIYTGNFIKK